MFMCLCTPSPHMRLCTPPTRSSGAAVPGCLQDAPSAPGKRPLPQLHNHDDNADNRNSNSNNTFNSNDANDTLIRVIVIILVAIAFPTRCVDEACYMSCRSVP